MTAKIITRKQEKTGDSAIKCMSKIIKGAVE